MASDSPVLLESAAQIDLFEVFQCQVHPGRGYSKPLPALTVGGKSNCVIANHVFGYNSLSPAKSAAIAQVADELSSTVTAVLIAFAAFQPGIASVITGTHSELHLRANAAAVELNLTAEHVVRIQGSESYA